MKSYSEEPLGHSPWQAWPGAEGAGSLSLIDDERAGTSPVSRLMPGVDVPPDRYDALMAYGEVPGAVLVSSFQLVSQ